VETHSRAPNPSGRADGNRKMRGSRRSPQSALGGSKGTELTMIPLEELVERRRKEILDQVRRVRLAALVWGPTPVSTSPQGQARLLLRDELTRDGHLVRFSEDLIDPASTHSVLLQQVAQAEAHDIVFSLPGSPGSTAEIHDFARIPGLSHKIVAFLDTNWSDGYSNQSLLQMQSTATCQIQLYRSCDLPDCIIEKAREMMRRLQEFYFLAGRRF
jgi:hypothetical protein